MPDLAPTALSDAITEHSVLLVGHDGEDTYAAGTGFFIGLHIAMTAKHVIRSLWQRFEQRDYPRGKRPAKPYFRLEAIQFLDGEPSFWTVRSIVDCPGTDLSFLHLIPSCPRSTEHIFRGYCSLSAYEPSIGETVASFGYPGSSGTLLMRDSERKYDLYLSPSTTHGHVLRVDSDEGAIYPWPCFETDGVLDHGMSGGPAFNEAGKICGVNCGVRHDETSGEPRAIYAMVWPALGTNLHFELPGITLINPKYAALELAEHGYLHWEGWDVVRNEVEAYEDALGETRVRRKRR